MHIISFDQPTMDRGGAAAALTAAWHGAGTPKSMWWHMAGAQIKATSTAEPSTALADLPPDLVAGHYRYCNAFLWPVLHDLPQYAAYRAEDHTAFIKLNRIVAWYVAEANAMGNRGDAFVHDYQLALVPQRLRETTSMRSALFWHVPWPKQIFGPHREALRELARAMLHSEVLGFHTEEYAHNFLEFVEHDLPAFNSNYDDLSVWTSEHNASTRYLTREAANRFRGLRLKTRQRRVTKLIVEPLPIDVNYWGKLASAPGSASLEPALQKSPYILSVDRADYTTGLNERLEAIDTFFQRHEEWRGRLVFLQVCDRTRTGIGAFDGYYRSCELHRERIQEKWSSENWNPLVWLDHSLPPAQLAALYSNANAMLLNDLRDGLNLWAKEFVASQVRQPGALLLSPSVGAFEELKGGALQVPAQSPEDIAQSVQLALTMDLEERRRRVNVMQKAISKTKPSLWWQLCTQDLRPGRGAAAA